MALQEFLNQTAKAWPNSQNVWVLLAKHGHPGLMAPFDEAELEYLDELKAGIKGCPLGFCYMNAQKLALAGLLDPRVQYVEGLVQVCGVPIDHAWIEFNGKVYDPTITDNDPPADTVYEYQGIAIPKKLIFKHQLKSRKYSPLSQAPDKKLLEQIWKIHL